MKISILTCVLILLSPIVVAQSTTCTLEESEFGIKTIVWDSSTLAAKVTEYSNDIHEGKVTLEREHQPYGVKTNIYVQYQQPYFGQDAAEYVIFPTGQDQYRVIGVGYVFRNNQYYLSTSQGNYQATCKRS
ncbi:hypothetical protein [Vibrio gazogenes]|uniref:C-type lysozyme inhibitor domain-containing protein n=1 Tax=Vibrio gazogenes TaxID=687 RepID=A0A1Z2SJR4_VIBGA|nr:hypothetical protein [Vibrio gazogenes]ASA57409.1 hypothetical protein BSQ33_16695 [Vibrio gazogenes]